MLTGKQSNKTWADLAAMIAALPAEEQKRFHGSIRELIHDLRQCLSIHHSAEALLRLSIPNTPENLELLDSIQTANQRSLTLITDFAKPFDHEIKLPAVDTDQPRDEDAARES